MGVEIGVNGVPGSLRGFSGRIGIAFFDCGFAGLLLEESDGVEDITGED